MDHLGIVGRLQLGWRAILMGAVLGALLFSAYAMLTRSAGSYSTTLTYQLADPKAMMAELNLAEALGVQESATGVAGLLQAAAVDSYKLDDVRIGARGIDGSRTVVVTLTGERDAVAIASTVLQDEFPNDRAALLARAAERALVSTSDARDLLKDEVTRLDDEVAKLDLDDGVLRERLLLDRLETTRAVLAAERQIRDLGRLGDQDPFEVTRLVVADEGVLVGTSIVAALWLGLVFGALAGFVVLLSRQDQSASKSPKQPVEIE